jgi:hypothetical protein
MGALGMIATVVATLAGLVTIVGGVAVGTGRALGWWRRRRATLSGPALPQRGVAPRVTGDQVGGWVGAASPTTTPAVGSRSVETVIVSIRPRTVASGGKVSIGVKAFGDIVSAPWTFRRSTVCEVLTPDGRVLSARARPLGLMEECVVFPDDFPYASTELKGECRVTVHRKALFSLTERRGDAASHGSFSVENGGEV